MHLERKKKGEKAHSFEWLVEGRQLMDDRSGVPNPDFSDSKPDAPLPASHLLTYI